MRSKRVYSKRAFADAESLHLWWCLTCSTGKKLRKVEGLGKIEERFDRWSRPLTSWTRGAGIMRRSLLAKCKNFVDLVIALTHKELKVRYKRSVLGYLWSVANPLALALVFYVAFKIVMKINIPNYTLFLISGLFPWQWFSTSVNSSALVFIGNAALIKKVDFRREVLVVASIMDDMLHFLFSVPVIVIFLYIYGNHPHLSWIVGLPCYITIQFIITFGFSLLISSINLFFRDLERLVFIFITLLFYITPVIYPEEMIPEKYRSFFLLNPLSDLIVGWRLLFIEGIFDYKRAVTAFVYSLIVLGLGYLVFNKLKWKFAEVL